MSELGARKLSFAQDDIRPRLLITLNPPGARAASQALCGIEVRASSISPAPTGPRGVGQAVREGGDRALA